MQTDKQTFRISECYTSVFSQEKLKVEQLSKLSKNQDCDHLLLGFWTIEITTKMSSWNFQIRNISRSCFSGWNQWVLKIKLKYISITLHAFPNTFFEINEGNSYEKRSSVKSFV